MQDVRGARQTREPEIHALPTSVRGHQLRPFRRHTTTQGAYCVWVPDQHKVVTTSEVYHDETLMPWRPAGSQRISDPGPIPADGDADQPVTIPLGDDPGAPPAPANTLAEEFKRLVSTSSGLQSGGQATPASLSRHMLILFSGPKDRPDGLMTFLRRLGFSVTAVDNDPKNGGGERRRHTQRCSLRKTSSERPTR